MEKLEMAHIRTEAALEMSSKSSGHRQWRSQEYFLG